MVLRFSSYPEENRIHNPREKPIFKRFDCGARVSRHMDSSPLAMESDLLTVIWSPMRSTGLLKLPAADQIGKRYYIKTVVLEADCYYAS